MKTPTHVRRLYRAGRRTAALIAVLLLPVCTQAGTASVTANCRSVLLEEWTGVVLSDTVWVSTTTYDGSSGWPLGLLGLGDEGFDNSEELRPRSGSPGAYEADYVTYQSGVVAYGWFVISLPTTDNDGNGLPDVTQKNMPGDATFSGNGNCDWHILGQNYQGATTIKDGYLTRSAGAISGTFGYTSVEPGGITVTYSGGVFHLNVAEGTAFYTRGITNSMSLNLTLNDGETVSSADATTTFTVVNSNQITLPVFSLTLRDTGATITTVQTMTLNRTGQKYRGEMTLLDGDPTTYWPDYTRWVVEIEDTNDADYDGVPDLSAPISPSPHRMSVIDHPTGGQITLRIEGDPYASYTLQASWKPSSNDADWTDRETKTADAQGLADFTQTITGAGMFYRTRLNP